MLTRLYVDNFRCLEDFEFKPKQVQLIVGPNGTGKSTLFHVIEALRRLSVDGVAFREALSNTTTKGRHRDPQRFEVETSGGWRYRLDVERKPPKILAKFEELKDDDDIYFRAEQGKFTEGSVDGTQLRTDRSSLASTEMGAPFRYELDKLLVIRIEPGEINGLSKAEEPRPNRSLSNLVGWFRHLAQNDPKAVAETMLRLGDVLSGFETLLTDDLGEQRRQLKVRFRFGAKVQSFSLDQLSDGQRCLIGLYLLTCGLQEGRTLLIDEPENFIALAEIQPWLLFAEDRARDVGAQLIIASHHPEILNALASDAILLERDEAGKIHAVPFSPKVKGLAPAEIMARGWESA